MGLKGDRVIYQDRVDYFLNEAATRGNIVVSSTVGSGVSLDNTAQLGTVAAAPSGTKPVGVLMNDVVSIDTTRAFLNTQKNEVPVGSKVHLLTDGWIVTDNIEGTPTAKAAAYIGNSGQFATAAAVLGYGCLVTEESNATSYKLVGSFETTKNEDGYAKINVKIK